jgi:hypothetical protein
MENSVASGSFRTSSVACRHSINGPHPYFPSGQIQLRGEQEHRRPFRFKTLVMDACHAADSGHVHSGPAARDIEGNCQ